MVQAFRLHGEIEEGAVIVDKTTGKSRGYGFITYKHMESTQSALQAPSKLIDVSSILFVIFCMQLSFMLGHEMLPFYITPFPKVICFSIKSLTCSVQCFYHEKSEHLG